MATDKFKFLRPAQLEEATVKGVVSATNLGGFYVVDNVTGKHGNSMITRYDFFDSTPKTFSFANERVGNVDFSYYFETTIMRCG